MHFSILRLVIFVFIFQVEIKIHASNSSHDEAFQKVNVVELPKNCMAKKMECAIRSESKVELNFGAAIINMGSATSVVKSANADSIRLLNGSLGLMSHNREIMVKTDHAEVFIEPGSRVHFEREEAKTIVRVIRGTVRVLSKDAQQRWVLSQGFQNWFGRIDDTGKTRSGIVQAVESRWIDEVSHLRNVASIADAYQALIQQDGKEEAARQKAEAIRQKESERQKAIQKKQFLRRVLLDGHDAP
ncbi:MAG: hypothetical protein AB7O96_19220 [Pseudobdellovibrionaceae bacterium]